MIPNKGDLGIISRGCLRKRMTILDLVTNYDIVQCIAYTFGEVTHLHPGLNMAEWEAGGEMGGETVGCLKT